MADLIQSVTRALRILDTLAAHPEGLTVKEIAGHAQLNVSTTHHLVNTLKASGYVSGLGNGTYCLGSAIPRLYSAFLATMHSDKHLHEILQSLAKLTNETAYIGAWHNGEVVIEAIVEGSQALRVGGLYVGYSGYTHARATGKALLAYLNPQELDAYLASHRLVPVTPYTLQSEEELRAQLRLIAEQGFAVDREEFAEGVCCVAAPVFTAEGQAVAALTVSAPAWRFTQNEHQLVDLVVRAAHDASAAFGFRSHAAPDTLDDSRAVHEATS